MQRIDQQDQSKNSNQQQQYFNSNQFNQNQIKVIQDVGTVQNDRKSLVQEISQEEVDEREIMQSKQFFIFKKSIRTPAIVKYKSQIVNSDEDEDEDENKEKDNSEKKNEDKEKEKEKEKEREKERQRQREIEKEKERQREIEKEKERQRELEKEKERQREIEKEKERQREIEKEKERQRELEKEKEKERQREIEKEKLRQREIEKERQRELEKEKERQREIEKEKERQREIEKEKERQRELEKEKEKERQREIEKEKLRQREIEKERQRELEKEKERQREIEKEKERQREIEKEKERQREIEREKEKERQREIEKEKLRQREIEKERQREIEKEKERQREIEKEKERQREIEKEKERQREIEKEKERQREIEKEKERQREIEREKEKEREKEMEKEREKEKDKIEKIDQDKDDDEEEVKVWTAKSKVINLPKQEQQHHVEKEEDVDYLKPLNFEEVLKQSQIHFSLKKQQPQNDKIINKSSFGVVLITQVDSEDEQSNQEELADEVIQVIGSFPTQESEVTAENRIMMSVMQTKFTQSIQKQLKMQQSLQLLNFLYQLIYLLLIINNSSKSNQQDDIFKSKIVFINQTPVIVREDDVYIRIDKIYQYQLQNQKDSKLLSICQTLQKTQEITQIQGKQKKYVSDLNIIKEQIQQPLLQLIDNQDHVKFMFNLDSIYYFNFEFLKILLSKEKNVKFKPYAKIMDEITVLLAGFKFYYDYCKEFDASKKMRDNYFNTNQIFKNFFLDLKKQKNNQLNNLDVESYLIKPVQRLPKYILLYKDLLKHTNKDHPDFKNIEQCLLIFEQINDKNNNEMKVYLEQLKLIELQNQFGQYVKIAEPNRVYCFEEFCSIYTDKKENNIILYAFNNLLLFAQKKQNGQQIYSFHLQLSYQCYVKDKENTNYFEHFFEVVNKTESIIIINQDKESKIQLLKKIEATIQQLKQKQMNMENLRKTTSFIADSGDFYKEIKQQNLDYEIKVIIIGTEIRNNKANPYTVYVVQIYIQEYQTKIFVRYSQIVSLQSIVSKYDSSLKVPVLSTLNWFHSIDSKVIEERKIQIEKYLSSVLNSSKCQNSIEYQKQVLELLSLNQDFFSIPKKQKNQASQIKIGDEDMMKMILQSQFSNGIRPNLLQSMIMNRQSTNILQAAKSQAQRSILVTMEQDNSVIIGKDASKAPYFIEVSLMDGRTITVGFNKQTLTLFIKNEVAKFVGLKQWLDFRLFIVDQNKDQRVIDDDETMSSILDAHTNQNYGLMNAFKKLFTYEQKFQFIFRKYFFLSWKQEEADYKQDEYRLRYIVYDLIWETRNEKFQFSFNEFCLITALFFYSTNKSQDQLSLVLSKTIPKSILKSKKEEVWLREVVNNINILQQQLKQVQNENQQSKINKNKKLSTSISELAQLMIMNFYKNNQLFGMSLFFVECNKETIQLIQKHFKIYIKSNIFIGLNYNGFHIMKPENKSLMFTCPYGKLQEMKACTTEFCCTIDNAKLTFKTQFPFEIKSLIQEYQQLHEFTKQLTYCGN